MAILSFATTNKNSTEICSGTFKSKHHQLNPNILSQTDCESMDDEWVTRQCGELCSYSCPFLNACVLESNFLCHFHVGIPWGEVTITMQEAFLLHISLHIPNFTMHNANCIFFHSAEQNIVSMQLSEWVPMSQLRLFQKRST